MVRPLHQQNAVDIKGGREGRWETEGWREGGMEDLEVRREGGKEGTRGEVREREGGQGEGEGEGRGREGGDDEPLVITFRFLGLFL